MQDIVQSQPIAALCENCNLAIKEVSRAFELMASAQERIKPFLGEYASCVPNKIQSYDICRPDRLIAESIKALKQEAWRNIADRLQVYVFMTEKRQREFRKHIEDGNLPDITLENIQNFYETFSGNIKNFFNETLQEAFEILRPRQSHHKTNTEYEIGKKCILSCHGEILYSLPFAVSDKLTCIDNVFHLLEGRGVAKHPETLSCKINDALQKNRSGYPITITTEYFKVKLFKKSGTIHIEFTRADLVKKLNAAAGGNRIVGK